MKEFEKRESTFTSRYRSKEQERQEMEAKVGERERMQREGGRVD